MAVPINTFVGVNVAIQSAPVAAPVFGIPLFYSYESELPSTPTYYSPDDILAELEDLGITSSEPVYLAAQAIKDQSALGPLPEQIGVVKRLSNVAQVSHVTFSSAANNSNYTVTISQDGAEIASETYTSDGSATAQEIVEGLTALLEAALPASTVAVTEDNTKLILTAEVAGVPFSVVASSTGAGVTATITANTANRNGATQLADIWEADKTWYILVPLDSADFALPDLDVTQIAAAMASLEAVAFLQSSSADIIDAGVTDDPASVVQDASNSRALVLYHADTDEPAAAALAGRMGGYDPSDGLTPIGNKKLVNITSQDVSSTELAAAVAKRASIYVKVINRSTNLGGYVRDGLMAFSLNWPQRIGVDWSIAQIRQEVFTLMDEASNAGRDIPFTAAGLQMIGGALGKVAADMLRIGLIGSPATVTVPALSDIDAGDVAAGRATGFKISGTAADSVIYAEINAYLARSGA